MRESFVIHTEYIEDLPEESKSEFLMYIYNYGAKEIEPKLEGFAKTVWLKIQRRIDSDIEQYEDTVKARSAAGRKHKGNQYTNKLEQNGTNGTQFQSLEQNGTNGTVSVFVSDNEFVNESDSDTQACACAPSGVGLTQKECFEIIQAHNAEAPKERKIPCSGDLISFMQKEFRELIASAGTQESLDNITAAVRNYIKVAKSDTWQKTFTWRSFCKNYRNFTPEYFTLAKYLNTEPETEDGTQKPEYAFYKKMRDNRMFDVNLFETHVKDWYTEGRPEGSDYFKLQEQWEAEKCS